MITTTLVTGTLMFDGSVDLPENAKIFVTLSDANGTVCGEKQVDFDRDSLKVFKYLPFEWRNFEMPEAQPARLSASVRVEGSAGKYQSRDSVEIKTGLEEAILTIVPV